MDENLVQEILDALFSSLEHLETRTMAILQFMKDKGLATEEELAPHLEQAANASNVRWRAARVRINHLLSSAQKPPEEIAEKKSAKAEEKGLEPVPDSGIETEHRKDEEQTAGAQKPSVNAKPEERKDVATTTARDENKQPGTSNGGTSTP
jgi:transcriptional accessory protein Tex/SPT6